MARQRYDYRMERDNTWTVFDVFTGQAAIVEGFITEWLTMKEADDLVDLLNRNDLHRRGVLKLP